MCHALKMIACGGRIITDSLLLVSALFNDPTHAVPEVIGGILSEIGAAISDAINVILSAILLVTITLMTLINFGYVKDLINDAEISLYRRGDLSDEEMMFGGMFIADVYQAREQTDKVIFEKTTSLSA